MSSSGNKETLFGIDFDIGTPINTEVKYRKSRTIIQPGDKYPMLRKGMTRKDLSSWNLSHRQEFLADRGINKTENKDTLVTNENNAYKMNLEIKATDYIEEKNEVELNLQSKLVLENGLVNLPDPSKLIDGWFTAPYNLPSTIYEQVNPYLRNTDAGKAFKGEKSLLFSGHIKNMMTHSISSNIRYCIMKGLCHSEQKLGQNPYCLNLYTQRKWSCSKW